MEIIFKGILKIVILTSVICRCSILDWFDQLDPFQNLDWSIQISPTNHQLTLKHHLLDFDNQKVSSKLFYLAKKNLYQEFDRFKKRWLIWYLKIVLTINISV